MIQNDIKIQFDKKHFSIVTTSYPYNNNIEFNSLNCSSLYTITNQSNKRLYVGTTEEFLARIKKHYRLLLKGTHFSKDMQHDFDIGNLFLCVPFSDFNDFRSEQIVIHKYIDKGFNVYNTNISKK
jgi:hypothetical protein